MLPRPQRPRFSPRWQGSRDAGEPGAPVTFVSMGVSGGWGADGAMRVHHLAPAAALAAIVLLSSGCATVVNGTGTRWVSVRSAPIAASVRIVEAHSGKLVKQALTPFDVSLAPSRGYYKGASYRMVFEAPGFKTVEVEIDSRLSGWYFGNIALSLFGVVGAFVVDPLTGAMWTLAIDELSVTLPPLLSEPPPSPPPPEPPLSPPPPPPTRRQ